MSLDARAATSPELALLRTEGQWGKYYAAILAPTTVYSAQVNQVFPSTDKVIEVTYDNPTGTLSNVLADMTMLVGSTAGAHDKGICRVKSIDGTKIYIGETSHIAWADNLHLTILRDWSLWARHVRIVGTTPYMDGTVAYSDQHDKFEPVPIMGCHRVLKLTGASVSTQFNFGNSYVQGSSISAYSTSAPSASGLTGATTSTPTATFNTTGWHPVYLTLTAANGKTFWGVRWVYVWNDSALPSSVEFPSPLRQSSETGGWEFTIRLTENVDISTVRERALVIVFGEEYYGTTQQSIGQLAGCENIIVTGWIGGEEEIHWNPNQGAVTFTAYTAHYWFEKIPSYPDGVQFVTGTPTKWTEVKLLTLDKGFHHFIRWRTTATRVMDVSFTGDTKYTAEVHSIALNLWEQLREIGFLQILARPGVDRFNRLFIQVHPQLVPSASRTWATVMTITKEDIAEEVEFKRITVTPNAFVNLSGVAVNSAGKGTPYFSLSPGHTYPPYGTPEIIDHLLVENQSQSNTLAGLYRGWLNNVLPDISFKLVANNRMIDCFPRQKCSITIAAGDTPRGVGYSGNLIPKEVSLVYEEEGGLLHTEVTFEAETFADISVNGDIPGSEGSDTTFPPLPPLPPLPPIVLPPGDTDAVNGEKVIVHDTVGGLLYTENFQESSSNVEWITVNAGLTEAQHQKVNKIVMTPTGGIYVAYRNRTGFGEPPFIAYAPSIGSTFVIVEDLTSIQAKFPGFSTDIGVNGIGVDPITGSVLYVLSGSDGVSHVTKVYIGSGTTFAEGVTLPNVHVGSVGSVSYGNGNWRITQMKTDQTGLFFALNTAGTSIVRTVGYGATVGFDTGAMHVPVSTTDVIYIFRSGGLLKITQNGAVAGDFTTVIGTGLNVLLDNTHATDPTGMFMMADWDTGRRGRTSDGVTWVGIPNLPAAGAGYAYDYAGGTGTESYWVAGKGIIRQSPDWGNTWNEKGGNILQLVAVLSLDVVKAVG